MGLLFTRGPVDATWHSGPRDRLRGADVTYTLYIFNT